MAYSDFTLEIAVERFELTTRPRTDLFVGIEPVTVSEFIRVVRDEWAPHAIEVNTEKSRSELIISPVLMEATRLAGGSFAVYSGVSLDVDRDLGLFGRCDFLLGPKTGPFLLGLPWMAVVEAKNEDISGNLGQCVAAMVAVDRHNERKRHSVSVVHGCVTTGVDWLFLRLEQAAITFDSKERSLAEVDRILPYLTRINSPPGPRDGPAPALRSA